MSDYKKIQKDKKKFKTKNMSKNPILKLNAMK